MLSNMSNVNAYKNVTATGAVATGAGVLSGVYVNSTTAGTIKLWDNTAGSGTVINNTFTPTVGYHDLGNVAFSTGCFATIGGTIDATFHFSATM